MIFCIMNAAANIINVEENGVKAKDNYSKMYGEEEIVEWSGNNNKIRIISREKWIHHLYENGLSIILFAM